VIRRFKIQPLGKAGNCFIYSDVDVQYIGSCLKRIEADRDRGRDA
jgi:hypothetical protein